MVGLILVILWSAWQYLFSGMSLEAIWPLAVNFLQWWYIVWAILMGIVYLGLTLLLAFGGSIEGAEKFGPLGGAVGLIGGGCFGIFLLGLSFLFHYGALILGTILLKAALVNGTWIIGNLVFGLILVAIGLFFSRSRNQKTSSD